MPISTCSLISRLMLLGCLLISGCNRHSTEAANAKPAKPIAVIRADTMVVEKQVWPHRVRTQGSFIADEVSSIGAKVPGRVSEVLCDLGDQVELNAPLIKIDAEQYELLVAQAEAQLTQARSAVGLRDGDPLEKLNPEMHRRSAKRRRFGMRPSKRSSGFGDFRIRTRSARPISKLRKRPSMWLRLDSRRLKTLSEKKLP